MTAASAVIMMLTACNSIQTDHKKQNKITIIEETKPWTEKDVKAIALTLAGECYDDKPRDKRLVCEVILNRVSHKDFPNTIQEVVSAPNQFIGYVKQSRDITKNDIEVATQALQDWYDGGCQKLSEYLYFSAGPNRENIFRKNY